jgi:hypothetical protein
MAQLQTWSRAHTEAIRTGSLRSNVPLPVPTEQVRDQVSVPSRATVTMLLCHVYPEFKHLQAGITQTGATKANVCLLRDIEFLCEFAIPLVQLHVFSMLLNMCRLKVFFVFT